MGEFYPTDVLATSRALYEQIKAWAEPRGDITLLGGWAVYELVKRPWRMQSRDVDLIMHDRDALMDFDRKIGSWGLKWREHGRNRFNDCHFRDDPEKNIVVDAFKDHAFQENLFKGRRAAMGVAIKSARGHPFLPSLDFMVCDKVLTIPRRVRDQDSKRAKDLLDLHALVFHNAGGRLPKDLLGSINRMSRLKAAEHLDRSLEVRPQNADELHQIQTWLQSE